MNTLPQIRNENIVVQHLNDEVLIYFFDTNKAICLNSTSAVVFNHCNGKTTFDELKSKYKFTDDLIHFTLGKLNENNLLKEYQANSDFSGLSRRDVIKRIGLGSMIALPVISSVIAPTAINAASGSGTQANGTSCTNPGGGAVCQSGNCVTTQNSASPGVSAGAGSGGTRCCAGAANNQNAPGFNYGVTGTCSPASASTGQGCCSRTAARNANNECVCG